MPSYAHLTIIGHVGRDPEMRYLPDGTAVTSITVAISQDTFNRTTQAWDSKPPLWVRCAFWRDTAVRANERITKGALIQVVGTPKPPSAYTTKDGEVRASFEMTAHSFLLLSKRGELPPSADTEDDEAPF